MADKERRPRGRGRPRQAAGQEQRRPEQPKPAAQAPPPAAAQPPARQGAPGRATTRIGQPSTSAAQSVSSLSSAVGELSLGRSDRGAVVGRGSLRGRRTVDSYLELPEREEGFYGDKGQQKSILTNYFRINQLPDRTIYLYNCVFLPDIVNPRVRRVIVGNQRQNFGETFLFDGGASLYLPHMIDNSAEVKTYTTVLRDGEKVQVTFNLARALAPADPQILQILNVLVRRLMSELGLQQLNRNYFDSAAKQLVPGYKMEVWPGYVTSIRQHINDVLMMVDSSSKILRTDTVLDQLNEIHNKTRNPQAYLDEVRRQLLGQIVLTKYNNNTYRIDDFDFNGTPLSTFAKGGEQVNFVDYYQKHWNITITDTHQPHIITRPSRRDRNAGRMDNIILIPELCCMTGLTDDMRADFSLMKSLGNFTRKGPDERVKVLLNYMRRIKGNENCTKSLKQWGLNFEDKLVNVNARVMPEENICMGPNQQKVDARADWTNMLRKGALDKAVEVRKWILIFTQRDQQTASNFVNTLRNAGRSLALKYAEPNMFAIADNRTATFVNAVTDSVRKCGRPDIVVCLLPNKNKAIYDAVKKRLVLEEQIPSQCVVARTVSDQRKAMSACTKIGLQMNIKMGGKAWHVPIPLTDIMIMGFDTYHDSSQRGKSVGGFIASLDANCSQWFSMAVHHYTHEEVGTRMRPLFQAAMNKFYQVNGKYPSKFIMYRDGVSDGQLHLVCSEEVPQLLEQAAAMLGIKPDEVKLSYIICNKRINTRFFEQTSRGLGNPTPGTVVDNVVTRPKRFIFYIVPQSVNQGTVTPTQFVVCYHTLTLGADHMQRLAYKMCHQYYNWSGTVRVPAPCQYAHKLAFLCGQSLHQVLSADSPLNETLFYL